MDFAISEGRRESRITNPSESVSQERSASQSVSQSVSWVFRQFELEAFHFG